jgi:hypothetical protein
VAFAEALLITEKSKEQKAKNKGDRRIMFTIFSQTKKQRGQANYVYYFFSNKSKTNKSKGDEKQRGQANYVNCKKICTKILCACDNR